MNARGGTRPPVSVLMPVRNGAETVLAAVGSVLRDLRAGDELIVIDDGSRDGTVGILNSIQSEQLAIATSSGAGIVDALNTGLALAHGSLIARCDADDTWSSEHLQILFEALSRSPDAVAAFGAARLLSNDGAPQGLSVPPLESGALRAALLRGNPLIHGTVLARKSKIDEVGGYRSVPGAEDYDLWMRLATVGRLETVAAPVYNYRLSATPDHARKRRVQARSTLGILCRHARRTGQISPIGLLRNALSAAWVGKRFWYRA